MPIMSNDDFLALTSLNVEGQPKPVAENKPSLTETLGAHIRHSGAVVNGVELLQDSVRDYGEEDPDFNPQAPENMKGIEGREDIAMWAKNASHLEYIKEKYWAEEESKRIIAESSTSANLISSFGAELTDPFAWYPAAIAVKLGLKSARVTAGFITGMGLGVAGEATRESLLQANQVDRDISESKMNIMAGAGINAALGAGFALLTDPAKIAAKAIMKDAMTGDGSFKIHMGADSKPEKVTRSVGSKEVEFEGEALAYINKNIVKMVAGFGSETFMAAALRGLVSDSGMTNKITSMLFDHSNLLKKERAVKAQETVDVAEDGTVTTRDKPGAEFQTEGRAAAAQNMMDMDEAGLVQAQSEARKIFLDHTGQGAARASLSVVIPALRKEGSISYGEWLLRANRVARGGYTDPIAGINKTAQIYRKQIDNMADLAEEAGVLSKIDKEKLQGRNWMLRMVDVNKLNLDPTHRLNLEDLYTRKFMEHNKDGSKRVITPKAGETLEEAMARVEAKSRVAAEDVVAKQMREVESGGSSADAVESMLTGKPSFTKERSLWYISDDELEPFMVNDLEILTHMYVTRLSKLVRTKQAIDSASGGEGFAGIKNQIMSDFRQKIDAAPTDKAKAKLTKDRDDALELTADLIRASAGTLFKPGKYTKTLERVRQWQFMRLLGGVTISSFPELVMAPARFGLMNTLKHAYLPMIQSWSTAKLSRDQYKNLNIGLEADASNILQALTDSGTSLNGSMSSYDHAWSMVSDGFSKASGLTWFTSAGRRMAAQVGSSDLIQKMLNPKNISKGDLERLAKYGIGTRDFELLGNMIKKYSKKEKGSWFANTDRWRGEGSDKARSLYNLYVQRVANDVILKPGSGDIPLIFQKNDMGRLIFQFKSFMSAATGRVTIAGLQHRDARTFMGYLYLSALGSLSSITKDAIAGRDPTDDPVRLLFEGAEQAGILGMMGTVALNTALNFTDDSTRKHTGRNFQGTLTGPSLGLLFEFIGRAGDGSVSEGDMKAMMRLLPFSNLFYLKGLATAVNGD